MVLDVWVFLAILTKCTLYVGILGSSGTAICALVFQLKTWRRSAARFAVLGVVAAALSFMLKGVALTGDASGMTDPDMLSLLWDTKSGTALLYQFVGLLVLILGSALRGFGALLASLGGIVALWSFVTIGHIADRDTLLLKLVLALHLLTAAFWVGILAPLRHLALNPDTIAEAARLGHRFGTIASIAVPILFIAGGTMTWTLVGSPNAMITTSYGQALLIKLVVAAALLALAAANKLRFVPRLERGDTRAAEHLARSMQFERLAVLAILLATAVFTSVLTLPT